jgi:molybdopterin-binding protein
MNIKEAIRLLAKGDFSPNVVVGKVVSVNTEDMSAEIDVQTGPNLFDIRMRAVIDKSATGILITPKTESYVLVLMMGNMDGFIVAYSEIDEFKVITPAIQLGGDAFGGIPKVEPINEQLNAVKSQLNELKTLLNSWIPVPTDGGAALKAVITTWSASSMALSTKADFENEKVKHG